MGHHKMVVLFTTHHICNFRLEDTVKTRSCSAHTARIKEGLSSLGEERVHGTLTNLPLVSSSSTDITITDEKYIMHASSVLVISISHN